MTRLFIRLGDKTDHSGVFTTASTNWHIYGKPVAHAGDMAISDEQIARQSNRTACGARL
ncbi:MAG: PAAR domain-containing protein [Burkholderiaceae bacterium]|nr:PAAR domain-containing protein [Burkholderiaceae bacterium]